jgi:hypothetical protein
MSPVLKVFVQVFLQGAKFERSEWCNWAKRNSEGSERRLISMKTYERSEETIEPRNETPFVFLDIGSAVGTV